MRRRTLYASDDWDISRHFWLSAGVRLEYFNARGYGALNIDGATNNSRTLGWYLNNGTATKTRFNKDYLNPSVDVNARFTILKGFGLVGEYVFNR